MRTRLGASLLVAAFAMSCVGVAIAQQAKDAPAGDGSAALFESLEHGDVAARRKAVYALWQLGEWDADGALALANALFDDDAYVRTTGARALGKSPHFTDPVLARLGDALRDGPADVHLDAAKLLWQAGARPAKPIDALVAGLGDENPDVRANAAAALEWSGEGGATAVPALSALVQDDEVAAVRTWAARALGSIDGGALLAALEQRVKPGGDAALRIEAIGQLGYARGADVAPLLAGLLAEDDAAVRLAAAQALGANGPGSAVDAVVAALDDTDPAVRAAALAALNFPGSQMQVALPRLIELLDSEDAAERTGAAVAIVSIDPDGSEARLASLLTEDPDQNVRLMCAYGMSSMRDRLSDASAAAVVRAVDDADPAVAEVAVQTLQGIGQRGAPARDTVLRLAADHERPFGRQWALLALPGIGVAAEDALPVLVASLEPDAPMIARAATTALGEYGASAAPAAARLAELVRADVEETVRGSAAMALARIGPAAGAATQGLDADVADAPFLVHVQALGAVARTRPDEAARCVEQLAALIDGDPQFGLVPITLLGEVGRAAAPAAPRLLAKLHDDAQWSSAALALGRIGGEPAEQAVSVLLAECASDDAVRRASAYRALAELPQFAERSVPVLVAGLGVEGSAAHAAAALGALGRAAASAAPALVELAKSDDPGIRHAARSALVKVGGL